MQSRVALLEVPVGDGCETTGEGADRAAPRDTCHAIDEARPRLGVLMEPEDVVHDPPCVVLVHEHVAWARVPFRVHRPLGIEIVEAERDDPVRICREDRRFLRINDTHDEDIGGDAVVLRAFQHALVAQAGDGRDHAILPSP